MFTLLLLIYTPPLGYLKQKKAKDQALHSIKLQKKALIIGTKQLNLNTMLLKIYNFSKSKKTHLLKKGLVLY